MDAAGPTPLRQLHFRTSHPLLGRPLGRWSWDVTLTWPLCVLRGVPGPGLHVPLSKVLSKTARCMQTTSAAAGLRVCGIQVFHGSQSAVLRRVRGLRWIHHHSPPQPLTRTPLPQNKHYGRSLTRHRLPEAMALFLSGADPPLRASIASAFVHQIERLRDAVAEVRAARPCALQWLEPGLIHLCFPRRTGGFGPAPSSLCTTPPGARRRTCVRAFTLWTLPTLAWWTRAWGPTRARCSGSTPSHSFSPEQTCRAVGPHPPPPHLPPSRPGR